MQFSVTCVVMCWPNFRFNDLGTQNFTSKVQKSTDLFPFVMNNEKRPSGQKPMNDQNV